MCKITTFKEAIMKTKNFVAKHARTFNRSVVQRDRKNDYSRKEKHKAKHV